MNTLESLKENQNNIHSYCSQSSKDDTVDQT
jgi:hypothetical protein